MKLGLSVLIFAALISIVPVSAQDYPGPPMWDRGGDYGRGGRWPPTRSGPQGPPCIYYGNCRGPRYEEDPEQSWRRPGPPPGWGRRRDRDDW